ncbi:MAG: hypothetical protein GX851_04480, partial [Clostridiales bacterium]|nr:hypothetical protein [Clostridiales bacterium]
MKTLLCKKTISLVLALCLILPLAISPMGVSAAAISAEPFRYNGLQITPVEGGTAVLNVVDKTICGIKIGMTATELAAIFTPDPENVVTVIPTNGNFCGNGTLVEVRDSKGNLKETFTVIIFGDINSDSVVDAIDGASLELFVSGHATEEEIPVTAADIDGDGKVDINDLSASINDTVEIAPIDQGAAEPEVANTAVFDDVFAQLFTGEPIAPDVDIKFNNIPLSTDDFDIVYEQNTGLGTATITITGKGIYTGTTSTT